MRVGRWIAAGAGALAEIFRGTVDAEQLKLAGMKLNLKRVAPLQAGKLLGGLYGVMGLIFVPIMILFMGVGAFASAASGENAPPMPFFFGMGIGFMIVMPVFYAAMGFVTGVLGALAYNLLAKWLGGFELEFEEPGVPPRV